ncbi:peptide/nickel transport system permease protein [Ignavigranum ruoffiae]|uniref:Peptide/nickel transport system permease protein n=1 Tax=Ignavigranum ruoffiae TaxID=89093 RepID=A0A1H9B5G0_9LACT|nr:ABC transporter permease [Ignavigranum ruoffiae]SEP83941.1 peptide/nickel transport system permease protein [Ignavigranum ruoffiae]
MRNFKIIKTKNHFKVKDIYYHLLILILLLIVVTAFLAPVLFPINLADTNLLNRLALPHFINRESKHLIGTDQLGRDVFIRLIYAVKSTIQISFVGMSIALCIGTILGLISGYYGGLLDTIITFINNAMLSIPTTFIGIIASVILGANASTIIWVIAFSGWSGFCRLVRGLVMQLKNAPFIEAGEMIGIGKIRLVFRHILPNIASPLIVLATSSLSSFILLESTLSFLGLGIQPPNTSLGVMISEGRDFLMTHWWLAIIPSLFMIIIILCISLLGDWLRDKLDPKINR